jgi:hypothetical protein
VHPRQCAGSERHAEVVAPLPLWVEDFCVDRSTSPRLELRNNLCVALNPVLACMLLAVLVVRWRILVRLLAFSFSPVLMCACAWCCPLPCRLASCTCAMWQTRASCGAGWGPTVMTRRCEGNRAVLELGPMLAGSVVGGMGQCSRLVGERHTVAFCAPLPTVWCCCCRCRRFSPVGPTAQPCLWVPL